MQEKHEYRITAGSRTHELDKIDGSTKDSVQIITYTTLCTKHSGSSASHVEPPLTPG